MPLGKLKTNAHGVSGEVFIVDESTIFIKNFNYDGLGPDAYFWSGYSVKPDQNGFIIPDEKGSTKPLSAYKNKNVVLRLPEGNTVRDIKWIAVWCRKAVVNFGDVLIPKNVIIPTPVEISPLSQLAHGVKSGPITIVDAQTFLIPDFHYDGLGPAGFWWATKGQKQSPKGVHLDDENGSKKKLRRYSGETVVISLPEGKTVFDFDFVGVWCEEFQVDFGHAKIPHDIVVPPSPRMLGVKPEVRKTHTSTSSKKECKVPPPKPPMVFLPTARRNYGRRGGITRPPRRRFDIPRPLAPLPPLPPPSFGGYHSIARDNGFHVMHYSKLNCEVLHDGLGFEIRWVMDGDDVVMQLVGKIAPGEYMAFGLGRDDSKSLMIGADAVVVWYDRQRGNGHAVDYFLQSKEQCVGNRGSCPDIKQHGASDSYSLLHAAVVNDFTMVTFKRPQLGVDEILDQHVYSDGQQSVMWAIGPLNDRNEVSYHRLHSEGDLLMDFARTPKWNCPNPDTKPATTQTPATPPPTRRPPYSRQTTPVPAPIQPSPSSSKSSEAWEIPPIICPADGTFRAQIGPTGGKKGYEAITGKVGWGIAWFINGLLIPEITVQRGKTYTFIVEGGDDPVYSSRRHPMYITDSPEGGFDYKTNEERSRERVFAGVGITNDGRVVPTAEGRYCEWKIDTRRPESPEDFSDFFSFQRTLRLECLKGQPAILKWTPDRNTPDNVYYQCYTHRYLGWKIRVVDSCDYLASASISNSVPHSISNSTIQMKSAEPVLNSMPKRKPKKKKKSKNKQQVNNRTQNHSATDNPKLTFPIPPPIRNITRSEAKRARQLFPEMFESTRIQPQASLQRGIPELSAIVYQSPPSIQPGYVPQGAIAPLNIFLPPMYVTPHFTARPIVYIPELPALVSPIVPLKPKYTTTEAPKESRIGQNLHGGFLPLLINSKSNASVAKLSQNGSLRPLKVNSTRKSSYQMFRPSLRPNSTNNSKFGIPKNVHWSKPIVEGTSYKQRVQKHPVVEVTISTSKTPAPPILVTEAAETSSFESVFPAAAFKMDDVALALDRGSHPSSSINRNIRIPSPSQNLYDKSFNNKILKATTALKAKNSSQETASDSLTTINKEKVEVVDDLPTKEMNELSTNANAVPNVNVTSNGTDDAILSHVMSLIAEGATPPEVKISSRRIGTLRSTHVEIHRKMVSKRSVSSKSIEEVIDSIGSSAISVIPSVTTASLLIFLQYFV